MTISPSLVLMTATSFCKLVEAGVSFFSSAPNNVALNNSAPKIDIFMFLCSGGLWPSQISNLGVIFLQSAHLQLRFLQRPNPIRARLGRAQRRHNRNFLGQRRVAGRGLVFARNLPARGF